MTLRSLLQGRWMRHPLHPMLVHLPIGLWVASFIFDLLYLQNQSANFASSSYYCILIGLIGALIAAPTGLSEYAEIPPHTRAKRVAAMHFALNLVVIALYLIGFFARRDAIQGVPETILPGAILLSAFSLLLLSYSAYLGGLLVYDYGIGWKPHERDRLQEGTHSTGVEKDREPPSEAA